jgi:plastocyanin domain-containing protein
MNKILPSIVIIGLAIGIAFIVVSPRTIETTATQEGQNVEIRDGVQYITIIAKGGYAPKISTAQAGIPTKVVIKTNGTYDCSSSLVIRSLGYQKVLPSTGEEVIDVGTPEAGFLLQGMCSMGMYSFSIRFR